MASITLPKITLNAKEVGYAIKAYIDSQNTKLYVPPGYEADVESISVNENQRGGFESITLTLKPKM